MFVITMLKKCNLSALYDLQFTNWRVVWSWLYDSDDLKMFRGAEFRFENVYVRKIGFRLIIVTCINQPCLETTGCCRDSRRNAKQVD